MFIGILTLHYIILIFPIWDLDMFKNGPSREGFFLALLCNTQSGNDLEEDLARFGYKLNMKAIKKESLYIFGCLLETCIKIWWVFLKFGENYGY
jgi:hypothetical protein